MPAPYRGSEHSSGGFTLIELVIGIVTLSVVMTIIIGLINPQARRSVEPIYQVKATELAQSILNEVSSKLYDEHSDRSGGQIRCGEDTDGDSLLTSIGEHACSTPAELGVDDLTPGVPETRVNFDDIDDYNGFSYTGNNQLFNSAGNEIQDLYVGYSVSIQVIYDENRDGVADVAAGNMKLITVTVNTPGDSPDALKFSLYRGNF